MDCTIVPYPPPDKRLIYRIKIGRDRPAENCILFGNYADLCIKTECIFIFVHNIKKTLYYYQKFVVYGIDFYAYEVYNIQHKGDLCEFYSKICIQK